MTPRRDARKARENVTMWDGWTEIGSREFAAPLARGRSIRRRFLISSIA
jgi:hypothetical protein